jgi:cytochrome c-type biogenesis protein
VFALIGLPLVYGAGRVADAIPWLGLAAGVVAALAGLISLGGRAAIVLPLPAGLSLHFRRRWLRPLVFGVGYGVASLGCSLPVFLAFLAASLSVRGSQSTLAVLVAYTAGIATTILALGAGIARVDLQHPGRSPVLFSLFNADQGVPRLVLLVSPT